MPKPDARKVKVRIENPIAGTGITSLAHARRYVKRGLAEWTSESTIKMRDCHQRESARRTIRPIVTDGSGFATLEQVQNLPCAGPAVRAFYGRRESPPAEVIHTPTRVLQSRITLQSF